MNERLTNFLVGLASDPNRLSSFSANRAAELKAAGLTTKDAAAILSGDSGRIRQALGLSAADHMTQISSVLNPKGKGRARRK